MRTPHFIVLAIVFFCCCAAHAGPIFHTVSYAIGCGLPTMAAVTIYSVEGIGGLGGRVLFGVLADRICVKTPLTIGLTTQTPGPRAPIFPTDPTREEVGWEEE